MTTPRFDLLETLRWEEGRGFFLLDRHLRRLDRSAAHFNYRLALDEVTRALDRAVGGAHGSQRVRLLVSKDGSIRVESAPLEPLPEPTRLALAAEPIDPTDVFLFHKTTNRAVYERASRAEYDDVILWNPSGQITETTIANLVVELHGRKLTPPVECGLLPGTLREELLAAGEIAAAPVTIDELHQASRLWLINSVRGWREGVLQAATNMATTPRSTSKPTPTAANRIQR